jgi:PKD repeat protein
MPISPVSNPNGYSIIICNTSCDTTSNQGGCNTADQVAAYFLQAFGGTLRFHYTQYGCWTGPYDISAGGNCCIGALPPSNIPVSSFQSSDTSFCEKTCIDFTDLSTNNPTNWQWFFPGADTTSSNLQNPTNICYSSYGSFDVTLIACNNNGCDTLVIPGFINEHQNPAVPAITSNADTLFSTPAYAYQWFDSSGAIAGANGAFYVYQQPGVYYVIVSDSNGCATASNIIGTGINDHEMLQDYVMINPNPSGGKFEIVLPRGIKANATVEIYDVQGRMVDRIECGLGTKKLMLDVSLHSGGIYFVEVLTDHAVYRNKVIIKK